MIDESVMEQVHRELLDEKIVSLLSEKANLSPDEAMDRYYRSKLSEQIAEGKYGIQYLEPSVLVDDLMENEKQLF